MRKETEVHKRVLRVLIGGVDHDVGARNTRILCVYEKAQATRGSKGPHGARLRDLHGVALVMVRLPERLGELGACRVKCEEIVLADIKGKTGRTHTRRAFKIDPTSLLDIRNGYFHKPLGSPADFARRKRLVESQASSLLWPMEAALTLDVLELPVGPGASVGPLLRRLTWQFGNAINASLDSLHLALFGTWSAGGLVTDGSESRAGSLLSLLVNQIRAGRNVSVQSGASGGVQGFTRLDRHVVRLFDDTGALAYDRETLQEVARAVLIEVFSCRENRTNSGILALVAGQVTGADAFLPSLAREDFLSTLSRPALEACCAGTPVLPRARVKDTRGALVDHYRDAGFVHPAALFAPDSAALRNWVEESTVSEDDAEDESGAESRDEEPGAEDGGNGQDGQETIEPWPVAAE